MIFLIFCMQTFVWTTAFGSPTEKPDTPRGFDHRDCVFPFLYEGRFRNDCIFENTIKSKENILDSMFENLDYGESYLHLDYEQPYQHIDYEELFQQNDNDTFEVGDDSGWCSLTNNYDQDRNKTHCWRPGDEITDESIYDDKTCVFPYIFKNTTYYNCHELWYDPFGIYGHCGTTGNINIDRRFKYCNEYDDQLIESPEDSECLFPFQYKNETYETCTDIVSSSEHGQCATGSHDINRGRTYRNCTVWDGPLIESPEDSECLFPFKYKNETYETCTDIVSSSEHGQCATGSHDINIGRTYRNCTAWDLFLLNVIVEGFDVPCHFPFIFKNKSYDDCTSLVQDTKYGQCSTTSNFDKDGRYRNCTNVIGCHFPFVWKNQTHDDCIFNSFNDNWCSRTDNYDRDGLKIPCYKYRYRERMIEEDDTHECHFPYIYLQKKLTKCINHFTVDKRFICATTPNFNRDRKFKYCNQKEIDASLAIPTHLNVNCKFPFSFDLGDGSRPTVHHGCTTAKRLLGDRPYCLVEDAKGIQWAGRCQQTYLPNHMPLVVTSMYTYTNKKCIFPFEYKGSWFYGCTSFGHPDGRSWCATTKRFSGVRKLYDDFDLCVVEENTAITTFGGNGQGAKCHFPFKENEDGNGAVWNDKCIHKGTSWGWWCATTSDYTKDGKWGWCNVKNTDTKLWAMRSGGLKKKILQGNCHFPFIYDGKKHYGCYETANYFWCGTTADYDTDGSWKYCDKYDMGHTTQLKEVDQFTPCTFPFVYNGKLHFDLMKRPGSKSNRKLFCSTTRNYDRDRRGAYYVHYSDFSTGN